VINADARYIPLKNESVQCVVTSPPYFGLRDYKVDGQIGFSTLDEYIADMVQVFREIRRVLRSDGVVWLNLGDSYQSNKSPQITQTKDIGTRRTSVDTRPQLVDGLKPKDLIGVPWRVAFALQSDGWWLRQDIIWHKPNPMPESVTDRCTKAHEYIFLLSKSPRYYYDADAIAEPAKEAGETRITTKKGFAGQAIGNNKKPSGNAVIGSIVKIKSHRNKRSVWTVATRPYKEAHFATFPEKLVEPMILAGSKPGDTVLDPFAGTGTAGVVSMRHHRHFVGIELNSDYIELAKKRLAHIQPTLFDVAKAALR
jgi:DNA modification methylase